MSGLANDTLPSPDPGPVVEAVTTAVVKLVSQATGAPSGNVQGTTGTGTGSGTGSTPTLKSGSGGSGGDSGGSFLTPAIVLAVLFFCFVLLGLWGIYYFKRQARSSTTFDVETGPATDPGAGDVHPHVKLSADPVMQQAAPREPALTVDTGAMNNRAVLTRSAAGPANRVSRGVYLPPPPTAKQNSYPPLG